jgi:hypothetical protein
MNTMNVWTWIIIGGAIVLALLGLATWLFYQKKQSHRLKNRFRTEYDRTVTELKSRTRAESNLKEREKRVGSFQIVPLAASEAARFVLAWNTLQAGFVDNPKGVVVQADQLVGELMLKRGYPMGDFERRAADISVDHPAVVHNYRAAQVIALRDERGEASTEDLRKALVHFRALFNELLPITEAKQKVIQTKEMEMQS